MKRAVLIVNPFASRIDDDAVSAVERTLMRAAYVRTVRTERRGHAVELARRAGVEADAVVVFSGDGGFNEVLNGVERDDLPLGFVPGGGTSVLPRALGLPRDPLEAAEQLADALEHDRTRKISTGRVTDAASRSVPGSALTPRQCGGSTSAGARRKGGAPATSLSSARSRAWSSSGGDASTLCSRSSATGAPRSCSCRTC